MRFMVSLRPSDVQSFLAGEEVEGLPTHNVPTYSLLVDMEELEPGFLVGERFKVRLKRR